VQMRIDPRDSSRVMVVVDIDASAPISDQTEAELTLQGVTGLLYIDLLRHRPGKYEPPLVPSYEYPVIRARPSRLQAFLASLPDLATDVADLVQRADRLLSDNNLVAFSSALDHINKASVGLPDTFGQLNRLLNDLRAATAEVSLSAKDLRGVLDTSGPDIEATIQRLRAVSDNLSKATDLVDKIIADNRQDIRSFTRDGLPELERFLREGRAAAEEIRALSTSLRENPSQLLYQQQQQGVEIPR
jgi:phospholipid/cholesterol/gamma-HCH transport system substrate-binding protein